MNQKKGNRKKIIVAVIAAAVLLIGGACIWYVNDYYRAEACVEAYLKSGETVAVTVEDNVVFLDGSGTEHAVIFYPGAKVEYTAYAPMFYALAEQGIDCFLVKMPANLAILGSSKAEDIMKEYEYENWYLSGHSLGGAVATSFAAENSEALEGIILLAAYPMKDLSDTELEILSLYGSEDKVLNMENVVSGRDMVPEAYTEHVIEGGNHAWFAYYGEQTGDGVAVITKEAQQEESVEQILDFVHGK